MLSSKLGTDSGVMVSGAIARRTGTKAMVLSV